MALVISLLKKQRPLQGQFGCEAFAGISESLLRVDMKVALTGASKGRPGCAGAHQEKGSPLWKTPSTFNWIGKNGRENGW